MNRPWMPLYIGSYLKKTSHLRALESGAYLHLIMAYWVSGKLPNDDKQLATIAKLTDAQWKACKPTLAAFFGPDWSSHERIDEEIQKAEEVAQANTDKARDAANKRWSKHKASNAPSMPQALPEHDPSNAPECTLHTSHITKDSEANASGADAPDIRTKLFNESLKTLARITGKTPDSCRGQLGKWLKAVNDEAIHVVAAIEDAERNRIVDPVAWINRVLQPRTTNGQASKPQNGLSAALRDLRRSNEAEAVREVEGVDPSRLLSHG
jgi:uncharacterized protein YdaU (DUF1376 family)